MYPVLKPADKANLPARKRRMEREARQDQELRRVHLWAKTFDETQDGPVKLQWAPHHPDPWWDDDDLPPEATPTMDQPDSALGGG